MRNFATARSLYSGPTGKAGRPTAHRAGGKELPRLICCSEPIYPGSRDRPSEMVSRGYRDGVDHGTLTPLSRQRWDETRDIAGTGEADARCEAVPETG